MPRPGIHCRAHLVVRGVGVSDAHNHTRADEAADDLLGPIEFGGDRHESDGPRCQESVERPVVTGEEMSRVVGTTTGGRQKRPLHVGGQPAGAARWIREHLVQAGERPTVSIEVLGVERRLHSSCATPGEEAARDLVSLAIGYSKVDSGDPVHLQVDQAGHRDRRADRGTHTHSAHQSVDDLHVTADERSADKRRSDT